MNLLVLLMCFYVMLLYGLVISSTDCSKIGKMLTYRLVSNYTFSSPSAEIPYKVIVECSYLHLFLKYEVDPEDSL